MFSSKNSYNILFLSLLSFLLLIGIFKWINYLTENDYIVETFDTYNKNKNINPQIKYCPCSIQYPQYEDNILYTENVDLPLNINYSCKNMCGSTGRCYITGQQCLSDSDCPGCQPYIPKRNKKPIEVIGYDDAGKLTYNQTPTYSVLTTDIGTHATQLLPSKKIPPVSPYQGVNTWREYYDMDKKYFDKRYRQDNPPNYPNNYTAQQSLSGQFVDKGPLPANANLRF
jgi:hypothetical protein